MKLINAQLGKNFPEFYCTWKFIIMFSTVHCWNISSTTWIQSTHPHPVSVRYISVFSSSIPRCSNWSLPFMVWNSCIVPAVCSAKCTYLSFFFLTICDEEYKVWGYLLSCFLLFLLVQNIVLCSFFHNISLSTRPLKEDTNFHKFI